MALYFLSNPTTKMNRDALFEGQKVVLRDFLAYPSHFISMAFYFLSNPTTVMHRNALFGGT